MKTYLLSSASCVSGIAYAPDTQTAVDVYEKSVKKFVDNLDPNKFSNDYKSRELARLLDITSIEVSSVALDTTHCNDLDGVCTQVWEVIDPTFTVLRPGRDIKDVLTAEVICATLSIDKALICM